MPTSRTSIELAIAAAATAATLTYAALSPQSQLFGHTLIAGSDPNEVALTYDDGPNDAATLALLDLLAKHNARATFFMIGRFVRQRREIVRAVHAAGHLIGNHTTTHPWLTMLPAAKIHEELEYCNAALEDALGEHIRYVRFPHGARRPAVLRIAHELHLTPVQWNAMAYDWKPLTPDQMIANVASGMSRNQRRNQGSNILLHDGHQAGLGIDRSATLLVTASLLERFATEGKRTVTVDAWG